MTKSYATCSNNECMDRALHAMKGLRVRLRPVGSDTYRCHCSELADWYISEFRESTLPRVGDMINGYMITAAYRNNTGTTTILASQGKKFVVATWLNPTEWHHGNYFDTDTDEGSAEERATRRFLLRSGLSAR